MVVEIDRVLRHAIGLDRVVVVRRGGCVRPLGVRAPGQRFVPFRGLAPDFRQHAIVARAFAVRHFEIVAFEILNTAAHVEREIEHPLLIVALRSELPYHRSSSSLTL